jgi:hypothetical protein
VVPVVHWWFVVGHPVCRSFILFPTAYLLAPTGDPVISRSQRWWVLGFSLSLPVRSFLYIRRTFVVRSLCPPAHIHRGCWGPWFIVVASRAGCRCRGCWCCGCVGSEVGSRCVPQIVRGGHWVHVGAYVPYWMGLLATSPPSSQPVVIILVLPSPSHPLDGEGMHV